MSQLPDSYAKGAVPAMVAATVFLCALSASFRETGLPGYLEVLFGAVVGLLFVAAAFVLVMLLGAGLSRAPGRLVKTFVACALALVALRTIEWPGGFFEPMAAALRSVNFGWPDSLFYPAAFVFVAGAGALVGWSRSKRLPALAVAAIVLNVAGLAWLASPGLDPYAGVEASASEPIALRLDLEDPSSPGRYTVAAETYGSGTDERRPEFGEGVSWRSDTVDASKILPEWKGFRARAREWYWGFSIEAAPINGRVWRPQGRSGAPYPLVLIVHGNHGMEDHSDPGYAYLGELLASRGFVTVSVDENFINGTWSGDFRGREMPARGFFLLEHLKQWRRWSQTSGHPMEGMVDLDRVALIGHSRGGEAVSIAAAFNRLSHFPDDATVPFDYGFGIQALVSIAQTDVRYERRMELENVSFLALQGSYDSDEASFFGMRQFRRIALDETPYRFKAGLYIHGANHGQFNSTWGRTDAGPPFSWMLNLAPIIPGEDQRRIAKVAIAAFLEASLQGELGYLSLFRNPQGSPWLPEGTYVHRFEDSRFAPVADFEEDIDVTTASRSAVVIETRGLSTWREEELRFRDDDTQGTNAVVVGWDEDDGSDSLDGEAPEYAIASRGGALEAVTAAASLVFASSGRITDDDPTTPVVSVTLEDEAGERATREVTAAPPLRVQFLKLAARSREQYGTEWEPTLQSYELPLRDFLSENPSLDVTRLTAIRFRFDDAKPGGVILDDVGFRRGAASSLVPEAVDGSEAGADSEGQ